MIKFRFDNFSSFEFKFFIFSKIAFFDFLWNYKINQCNFWKKKYEKQSNFIKIYPFFLFFHWRGAPTSELRKQAVRRIQAALPEHDVDKRTFLFFEKVEKKTCETEQILMEFDGFWWTKLKFWRFCDFSCFLVLWFLKIFVEKLRNVKKNWKKVWKWAKINEIHTFFKKN